MVYRSSVADHLRVEVKHRCLAPYRYTWEIIRGHEPLPLEESRDRFGSWEGASQAGKKALERKRESVAMGYLTNDAFAERLERAIARSDRAKLIEAGRSPTD
jgi:hypothetical protein